jgi:hypothetical protein
MIQSLKEAVEYFILQKRLQGAKEIIKGGFCNGTKGPISQAVRVDSHDYMVFFKREWFYKFGIIYNKPTTRIGQSFSVRAINYTVTNLYKAYLVVVMPNQQIFYVKATDAAEYIESNGTARTPSTESGDEGSIPATLLTPEDPHYEQKTPILDPGQTTLG